MIHFISQNTEPSQETIIKSEIVNTIKSLGFDAKLYGLNNWPMKLCNFSELKHFSPKKSDIVIIDNLIIENRFDLFNIDHYLYSHGRKKRVIYLFFAWLNYFKYLFLIKNNIKTIFFKIHKNQKNIKVPNCEISTNEIQSIYNCFTFTSEKSYSTNTIFYDDIAPRNNIAEKIKNSTGDLITLRGAILSPRYFKEEIIPLFNLKNKSIFVAGFSEQEILNYEIDSEALSKILKDLIEKTNI